MQRPDDDRLMARVAEELRRPVGARPGFEARVMAEVRRTSASPLARAWAWLREPRAVALSPLGAAATAAAVAAVAIVGTWAAVRSGAHEPAPLATAQPATAAASAPSLVTFVLLAPGARSVALAGDFDGWDAARLPLRRGEGGLWTLDVTLPPGRYRYAFVVDGRRFVADPSAPPAVGDDFGQPTSVVTVAGRGLAAGGSL